MTENKVSYHLFIQGRSAVTSPKLGIFKSLSDVVSAVYDRAVKEIADEHIKHHDEFGDGITISIENSHLALEKNINVMTDLSETDYIVQEVHGE